MPRASGQLELVPQPTTKSLAMRQLDRILRIVACKDVVITFVGESGTGKEILARRTHELSRRTGPFIPINCAAIPEALFESELFGHEKGAFTGAGERTRGKIERPMAARSSSTRSARCRSACKRSFFASSKIASSCVSVGRTRSPSTFDSSQRRCGRSRRR
jgi:hypothetical protein